MTENGRVPNGNSMLDVKMTRYADDMYMDLMDVEETDNLYQLSDDSSPPPPSLPSKSQLNEKIVHLDFFNKFEDLMDNDDLN